MLNEDYKIEPFVSERHFDSVFELWEKSLGDTWPIEARELKRVLLSAPTYQENDLLICVYNNQTVGFIATQVKDSEDVSNASAGLLVIIVDSEHQRRKVGSTLVLAAQENLRKRNVSKFEICQGGHDFFWRGVPDNLASAKAFFEQLGFRKTEETMDMIQDISDFSISSQIINNLESQKISITQIGLFGAPGVLRFEAKHFPHWYPYYYSAIRARRFDRIIAARNGWRKVVGAAMISPSSEDFRGKIWQTFLGKDMGAYAILGVAESCRGKGVGIGLSAVATQVLASRGVKNCLLNQAEAPNLYAKLGFSVWKTYWSADKSL